MGNAEYMGGTSNNTTNTKTKQTKQKQPQQKNTTDGNLITKWFEKFVKNIKEDDNEKEEVDVSEKKIEKEKEKNINPTHSEKTEENIIRTKYKNFSDFPSNPKIAQKAYSIDSKLLSNKNSANTYAQPMMYPIFNPISSPNIPSKHIRQQTAPILVANNIRSVEMEKTKAIKKISTILLEVDDDKNGKIDFEEFQESLRSIDDNLLFSEIEQIWNEIVWNDYDEELNIKLFIDLLQERSKNIDVEKLNKTKKHRKKRSISV